MTKIKIPTILLFFSIIFFFNTLHTICNNNELCGFHGGKIRRPSLVNDELYLNPHCYKRNEYCPCLENSYIIIYKDNDKKEKKRKGSND